MKFGRGVSRWQRSISARQIGIASCSRVAASPTPRRRSMMCSPAPWAPHSCGDVGALIGPRDPGAEVLRSGPIFRVFVSSTFEDFPTERNALQESVFPRLRERQRRTARTK